MRTNNFLNLCIKASGKVVYTLKPPFLCKTVWCKSCPSCLNNLALKHQKMNVLLNIAGSLLYYVFMFFLLPLLAVLLLLYACFQIYLFVSQLPRLAARMAASLHLIRRQMPARRRLATVQA